MKKPLTFIAATVFTATSSTTALAEMHPGGAAQPIKDSPREGLRTESLFSGVSLTEIARFSAARTVVTRIQNEFVASVAPRSDGPEKTASLERQARRKIKAAIKRHGLEVSRYHQIQLLARFDEDLRKDLAAS